MPSPTSEARSLQPPCAGMRGHEDGVVGIVIDDLPALLLGMHAADVKLIGDR